MKVLDDPQAKRIIEKTAAAIAGEGKLRMFVGPTIWQEEDDVSVKSLEAASECAVRLAKLLSRKESNFSFDQIRKMYDWDMFVIQLTLKILGFSQDSESIFAENIEISSRYLMQNSINSEMI